MEFKDHSKKKLYGPVNQINEAYEIPIEYLFSCKF